MAAPASSITRMGLSFVLRRSRNAAANRATIFQFVPERRIAPLQKALRRISTPAEAIMATTAGRSEPRTLCKTAILRYFR